MKDAVPGGRGPGIVTAAEKRHDANAFWLMGLLNSITFCLMLGIAKDILEGSVGLVYFASLFPLSLVRVLLPYIDHLCPYSARVILSSVLMTLSCLITAFRPSFLTFFFSLFIKDRSLAESFTSLVGVVCASIHQGVGEPTMLAYSAHFDGESVIPAWASGTGFSGLIGFAAMIACTEAGFDHRVVLLFALIIPVGFALVFFCILDPSRRRKALNDEAKRQPGGAEVLEVKEKGTDQSYTLPKEEMTTEEAETVSGGGLQSQRAGIATTAATTARSVEKTEVEGGGLKPNERCKSTEDGEGPLSFSRKVALFFSLWPWIFPYFLTFFAKYASMDGPWAAMGFPVTEERARKEFYLWALLCFQVGVVIARTFGNSLHWTPFRVWMIPLCQVGLLIGYVAIAGTPPVMTSDGALGWVLLVPAFLTGVLGGLIYIGIYLLVSAKHWRERREKEFALASVGIGDAAGVVLAVACGLVVQSCLYSLYGIGGAQFSCPFEVGPGGRNMNSLALLSTERILRSLHT